MNENIDPKLKRFEQELRRLKPVDVEYPLPGKPFGKNDKRKFPAVTGSTIAVLTLSLLIIFVNLRTPVIVPTHVPPNSDPVLSVVVETPDFDRRTFPGMTMREQLSSILAEYDVENPILPTHKPEYPVVEIVVSDKPITISPEQRHILQCRMKFQESLSHDLKSDRIWYSNFKTKGNIDEDSSLFNYDLPPRQCEQRYL